jgi:GT2 family glycosyltransferase
VPPPEVSVVVASHRREARLGALLDALAGQTLPRERFEVVVAHTYGADVAERVLDAHELGRDGVLRHLHVDPSAASPAAQRNAALRVVRAPLVAFTDDDCRPEADWLERLLGAAGDHPGQVVQGTTRPDPREAHLLSGLFVRTMVVDPPGAGHPTCNILYERDLVDRLGGFDERAIAGEDMDLAQRAIKAGASVVAAPDAVVNHAVEAVSLGEMIRYNRKWEHLVYVVKKNPELREGCVMRIWWQRRHLRAALALAGLLVAPRRPWALVAVVPYYLLEQTHFGTSPRQRARAVRRLPELWLVEIAEIGTFVRGSVRHRTLLL